MHKSFGKNFRILFSFLLICSLVFSGCSSDSDEDTGKNINTKASKMAKFVSGIYKDYLLDIQMDPDGDNNEQKLSVFLNSKSGDFSAYNLEEIKMLLSEKSSSVNKFDRGDTNNSYDENKFTEELFKDCTLICCGKYFYDECTKNLKLQSTFVRNCEKISPENPAFTTASALNLDSVSSGTGESLATADTTYINGDAGYQEAKESYESAKNDFEKYFENTLNLFKEAEKLLESYSLGYEWDSSQFSVTPDGGKKVVFSAYNLLYSSDSNLAGAVATESVYRFVITCFDQSPDVKWFKDTFDALIGEVQNNPDGEIEVEYKSQAKIDTVLAIFTNIKKFYDEIVLAVKDGHLKTKESAFAYGEKLWGLKEDMQGGKIDFIVRLPDTDLNERGIIPVSDGAVKFCDKEGLDVDLFVFSGNFSWEIKSAEDAANIRNYDYSFTFTSSGNNNSQADSASTGTIENLATWSGLIIDNINEIEQNALKFPELSKIRTKTADFIAEQLGIHN